MNPIAGAWYPVALSSGIEPRTSNGTRLFGREILVWRDPDGAAHVWEDRCPHRGMRLSLGFVRGNQIACLYHGWHYDVAGQCRYIPAHPQLTPPETIRVPVLVSAERMGMIWARFDGPLLGNLPPDHEVTPVRSITVECPPERALSLLNGLPPTPDAEAATDERVSFPPSLAAFGDGDDRVFIGVQPLSAYGCVLHVVVPGDGRGAGQKRASAWAETVRRSLEASVDGKVAPP